MNDLQRKEKKSKTKRILFLVFLWLFFISAAMFFPILTLVAAGTINAGYFVVSFIVTIALFITAYVFFCQFTNLYPLNDLPDDNFKKINTVYHFGKKTELHIYEKEAGIWQIDKHFTFDMSGFFFPQIYICSYFIRNIHYPVLNKNNYRLGRLFRSMKTEKYSEFKIVFHGIKRVKERFVVRNGKTKTFPLKGFLIFARFYDDPFNRYNRETFKHVKMDEKLYNLRKSK